MSETPATPVAEVPAPKLNALQLIEREIANFVKQREQAIANVHAVDGAIQAAQHLYKTLAAEANKAENFVKKELGIVEHDAATVVDAAQVGAASAEAVVKDNVVSIDQKL